jgi:hypothetical protein
MVVGLRGPDPPFLVVEVGVIFAGLGLGSPFGL